MGERPDYVKCIEDTHMDNKGKSWCGRKLSRFDWAFISVDHAAMSGRNGDRLIACPECLKAVFAGLMNGQEEGNG
ncbi:MAG TPA: hypothetical protein VGE09_08260 [Pseudoxanthomonas sp.]